jgi:N-acetylmuramic acid 6-phosphate etherase
MLPTTELENPNTAQIDTLTTFECVTLINNEDKLVAGAVQAVLPQIAETIDKIVERLKNGGRLFYIGTGTSGRLGVLDASEVPPTFGVAPELIQGIIAGGYDALYKATEASEDEAAAGIEELKQRGIAAGDAVVGIAASGRTPYTRGAVEFARSLGCFTACIVCSTDSPLSRVAEIAIEPIVGPEVLTGSTRMKAGTAQKMVLNMISTVAMIRLGYVRGNRMTNVKSSNHKLKERSIRILMAETGLGIAAARDLFDRAGEDLRVAIVMFRTNADYHSARRALADASYVIEAAANTLSKQR